MGATRFVSKLALTGQIVVSCVEVRLTIFAAFAAPDDRLSVRMLADATDPVVCRIGGGHSPSAARALAPGFVTGVVARPIISTSLDGRKVGDALA